MELEDFEHSAARTANPARLARWHRMIYAEKRAHAIGRLIRDSHEWAAEHVPIEADELVEVPHRKTDMTERTRFHNRK
jgi:hypothetical protein